MGIHATAIGNLGADPELKFTQGGKPVLNMSVGCSSGYGDKKTTTWLRVAVFGQRAEALSRMLGKGERVACVGVVSTREYTSKTGEQRSVLEMLCSEVELLGGRSRDGGGSHEPSQQRSAKSDDPFTDDLPF